MLLELPLYNAFKRIQLRPTRFITTLVLTLFVLIFITFILWFDTYQKYPLYTEIFFKNFGRNFSYIMIILQFLTLTLLGTATVESRVRLDTTSGIISFHKLTPLSPHNLIWGYILGSTFEIYISWSIFFIFGFLGVPLKGIPFYKYLFSSFLIVLSSIFFHIFALMNSLGRPLIYAGRGSILSSSFFFVIIIISFFHKLDIGFLTPFPSLFGILQEKNRIFLNSYYSIFNVPFFYFYIPPFAYSLILWISFGSIFYFSSKRRIIYEENPFFSKKESIFLLCIICFLVIGRITGILNLNPDFSFVEKSPSIETKAEFYIFLSKIIILFSSIILLLMTFPRRLDLIRQFIRKKRGEKIFWWENEASSLIINFLILIISVFSIFIIDTYVSLTGLLKSCWLENILRILIFISSMLFFNFLIEGCRLKFEKGADNISGLIIVFWFLLIPVSYIIYALNVENPKLLFMSFSPLPFLIFTGKPSAEIRNSAFLCLIITNLILFLTFLFWKKAKIDFGEKYG